MTRESLLAAICFLIAVMPFAGIPGDWKLYTTTIFGVIAGLLALSIRGRVQRLKKKNTRLQELSTKNHEGDTPYNQPQRNPSEQPPKSPRGEGESQSRSF